MSQPKLLIIDDDTILGLMMQNIARPLNIEARYTSDALQFFAVLEQWQPDVVVLDLVMPGMDGVQLIQELARRRCRARLIITSGVSPRVLEAAQRSAVENGLSIAGMLPKPFTPDDLLSLLVPLESEPADNALARHRSPLQGLKADRIDLGRALDRRELSVAYQPKICYRTGAVIGVEALARWVHPELGMVPPDHFIVLAEQHNLIHPLSRQIFEQALDWLAGLEPEYGGRLMLSINLSALLLSDAGLPDWLSQAVESRGLSTERVILELTETCATQDVGGSLEMLTRLRMRGFQLSIDDFGTGYSSLLQLTRMPFSELKIDKSFVMSAMASHESRVIIESIIDLGHNLKLEITAEGVEDDATLRYLCQAGCELLQGYYVSRPLPAEQAAQWLREYRPDRNHWPARAG
ncbi:GGDEF/EAL domain-containing response regulator [Oceanimonas marisflavi]|uniref:GGDEF/EAL domain-containing response regulator n=1 Tax=Oceanimonas marisflavi TaxID=2059724 RepID=UPI000D31284F|nr:EAL domain-containing response regulator [Oceanimonas marisflavi]